MTYDPSAGLTARQAWTLQHIVRCGCCNVQWVLVTDRVLDLIRAGRHTWPSVCEHLTPADKAAA